MPNTSPRDPKRNVSAFFQENHRINRFALRQERSFTPDHPYIMAYYVALNNVCINCQPLCSPSPQTAALFLLMRSFSLKAASDPYFGQMSFLYLRPPTEIEIFFTAPRAANLSPVLFISVCSSHSRRCIIYINIYEQAAVTACYLRHYAVPFLDLLISDDLA